MYYPAYGLKSSTCSKSFRNTMTIFICNGIGMGEKYIQSSLTASVDTSDKAIHPFSK
jgi:hypothetical protein